MTIEKFITQVVSCDNCPETFDTDEEEFMDAIAVMGENGWKARCEDGCWMHICPSCIEDEEEIPDVA